MAEEWGMTFLLFYVTFLFWLSGLALIVLEVLTQQALHKSLMIKDASASVAPIVLIIGGVVIFLITCFGCFGAWKEDCLFTVFPILLLLFLFAVAFTTENIFRNTLKDDVQDSLTNMIKNDKNGTAEFKDTVDKLQEDLKCCGANSSSDWRNFGSDGKSVPDSCCVTVTLNCRVGAMTDAAKVHQEGCHGALMASLNENIPWVTVIPMAVLQAMGFLFFCLFIRAISSGDEVEPL